MYFSDQKLNRPIGIWINIGEGIIVCRIFYFILVHSYYRKTGLELDFKTILKILIQLVDIFKTRRISFPILLSVFINFLHKKYYVLYKQWCWYINDTLQLINNSLKILKTLVNLHSNFCRTKRDACNAIYFKMFAVRFPLVGTGLMTL